MLQWGMPQFNIQPYAQVSAFNMFSRPVVNPFMPQYCSIFTPMVRPQYSMFPTFPMFNAFRPYQNFNFLNTYYPQGTSTPKPQGATSFVQDLWQSTKNVAKKGYEYAKTGYRKVKQSVASLMKSVGYNAEKGNALAKEAKKGSAGKFTGKCATYVKKAIERAGLGKYIYGVNGCDMSKVYDKNANFKKISAKGVNLKDLPAGCVLCYDAGKSGHHKVYGHTEITLGDGTGVSDGRTRNIKEASYILIPV